MDTLRVILFACLAIVITLVAFFSSVRHMLRDPPTFGTTHPDTLGDHVLNVAKALEEGNYRLAKMAAKLPKSIAAKKRKATLKPTDPPDFSNSIFVTIASYRDEECAPTIFDMYEKAFNPHSIFVGIVEQHFPYDRKCIPKQYTDCQLQDFCPTDQIQVRRVDPASARGPTYGRYLGMLMYQGQKYIMMIDSHNRFVTHWDRILVRMYQGMHHPKAVLSHYPEAWNNPLDKGTATNAPLDNRPTTTYLCSAKYTPLGFPRLDGYVVSKSSKPRPQPWAAAGFLFADARLLQEVPFDPHLDYVFDGEEILYSVRMWTNGWDIFSPSENILYHYYYRTNAKKFWSLLPPDWTKKRDQAHRRIQWYMASTEEGSMKRLVPIDTNETAVRVDNEKYGMGKERTVDQWYTYAGVDRKRRKIENKWCSKA